MKIKHFVKMVGTAIQVKVTQRDVRNILYEGEAYRIPIKFQKLKLFEIRAEKERHFVLLT